jgi:hypothetical protein
MPKYSIDWEPQPRQLDFLSAAGLAGPFGGNAEAVADEILYGGAAGGGKTDALLIAALVRCLSVPGARVIYFRRTFKQLSLPGAPIDRSRELFPSGYATYKSSEFRWTFKNGSILQFAHMERREDKENYKGAQFDLAIFDELTQFEEDMYTTIRGRVRSAKGVKGVTLAGTNPWDIGLMWVKQRFVDPGTPDEPFEVVVGENSDGTPEIERRVFLPAKLTDNIVLMKNDPGYKRRLMALPEAERKALLEGDWNAFTGTFFSEFRHHIHIIKPFEIPAHWPRSAGYDFGFSEGSGAAVYLQFAMEPKTGLAYLTHEYATVREVEPGKFQGVKVLIPDQAQRIKELWDNPPEYIAADRSIFPNTQAQTGESIAETFATNGVHMQPADNRRVDGWMRVHAWLAPHTDEEGNLLTDHIGPVANLRIFNTCRYTIATLPTLPHSKSNPLDVDTHAVDHPADALRYWTQLRPEPSGFGVYGGKVARKKPKEDEHPSIYEDEDYEEQFDNEGDMAPIAPRRRQH